MMRRSVTAISVPSRFRNGGTARIKADTPKAAAASKRTMLPVPSCQYQARSANPITKAAMALR